MFTPIEALLNAQIAESTPARNLCQRLEGKTLCLGLKNTGLNVGLTVEDGQLRFRAAGAVEPDAALLGGVLGIAGMALGDAEQQLSSGGVTITGDAEVARDFQRLLDHAQPDWEERLSRVFGDVAARQIGNIVRSFSDWGRRTAETLGRDVAEFLQEESRDLPTRVEADEYLDAVDRLREDTDRLEARVERLEALRRGTDTA